MMRLIIIAVLSALLHGATIAQDFTVMSLKGEAEYQVSPRRANSEWGEVAIGDRFRERDVLRTAGNSCVKLLHTSGLLLSIDQASTVKLGDMLVARIAKQGSPGTAALLNFVADRLYAARMNPQPGSASVEAFVPALPAGPVLSDAPLFRWIDGDSCTSYELVVFDPQMHEVYRGAAAGCEAACPSALQPGDDGAEYHWSLRRMGDSVVTKAQGFRVLPHNSAAAIREELRLLDAELEGLRADTATLHLARAAYLEKQGLFTDAFGEYRVCVALSPRAVEYREQALRMLGKLGVPADDALLPKE